VTGVENNVTGVENNVTGVENNVTGVENNVTGAENNVTGVENNVTGVENNVTGVENNVWQRATVQQYKRSPSLTIQSKFTPNLKCVRVYKSLRRIHLRQSVSKTTAGTSQTLCTLRSKSC